MAKRGRKSASDLAVASYHSDTRPDAPYTLTDDQAAVWRGIVDGMPASYFPPESFEILAAHCRSVVATNFLAREIDRFEPAWLRDSEGLDRYDKLLKLRDREVRSMLATARALRLTNQSRMRPETAGREANKPRPTRIPWE